MTLRLRRFDIMLAQPLERPDGSLLVQGVVARVGILEYEQPDGTLWREYVPAETLSASAAQLRGLPLTNDHPPEDVTPDNWDSLGQGAVVDAVYDDTEGVVRCDLSLNSRTILDAVVNGKVELSPGYLADVEETPGKNEYGEYDAVQVGRTYNHVAFVDQARGGPSVRARVDDARHSLAGCKQQAASRTTPQEGGPTMNPKLLALCAALDLGVDFTTDDEMISAVKRRTDSMSGDLAKKDMEISEMRSAAADSEGVESIDAEEYRRVMDENAALKDELAKMRDASEMASMRPMMDEYGIEAKTEDRADDIYRKIGEKITGQPIDKQDSIDRVRGLVAGHYAAIRQSGERQDGIEAGRQVWEQARDDSDKRQDHASTPRRLSPSALSDQRADAAFRSRGRRGDAA